MGEKKSLDPFGLIMLPLLARKAPSNKLQVACSQLIITAVAAFVAPDMKFSE